jgi:hypothetical protein
MNQSSEIALAYEMRTQSDDGKIRAFQIVSILNLEDNVFLCNEPLLILDCVGI